MIGIIFKRNFSLPIYIEKKDENDAYSSRFLLDIHTFCHYFLFFTDRKAQSSLARRILTGTPAKKHYRQPFHYA